MQSPAELKAQLEALGSGMPILVYRDDADRQRIFTLDGARQRISIGRTAASDISLEWDSEVSRLHAELELIGNHWTIADDGLSRNGTHLNGERVVGKKRLRDGDEIRFGRTVMVFRQPHGSGLLETVVPQTSPHERVSLSPGQRKVLIALCRPFKDSSAYATPATNQNIAEELVLSVEAVKTHLRTLFNKFGIEDLPQNQKRIRLAELALKSGVVTSRDL